MRATPFATAALATVVFFGTASGWATDRERYLRTAAIHPEILRGQGQFDPRGRPVNSFPITRTHAAPPVFARLTIARNGLLVASGYGRAGQHFTLLHNRRVLASVTVQSDNTWKITPTTRLLAGDHRLLLETSAPAGRIPDVGDELRISIPPGAKAPIDLRFNTTEEQLRNYAQSVGREASRVFDNFFESKEKPVDTPQIAQINQPRPTASTSDPESLMGQAFSWMGSSHDTYQKQIVPRLKLGGGLVLPPPGSKRDPVQTTRMRRIDFPTMNGITETMQSWFGESADNYDAEILPRLSGARPAAIVLDLVKRRIEPEARSETVELSEAQKRALEERREAEAQRRAAERARQRAEVERRRIAAEERAEQQRRSAEQARERSEAERRRIAAEQRAQQQRLAAERARDEAEAQIQADIERERERVAQEERDRRLAARRKAELDRLAAASEARARRDADEARQRARERFAQQQREQAAARRQAQEDEAERQRRLEVAALPPAPQRNIFLRRRTPKQTTLPGSEPTPSRMAEIWRRARRFASRVTASDEPETNDDERQIPTRPVRTTRIFGPTAKVPVPSTRRIPNAEPPVRRPNTVAVARSERVTQRTPTRNPARSESAREVAGTSRVQSKPVRVAAVKRQSKRARGKRKLLEATVGESAAIGIGAVIIRAGGLACPADTSCVVAIHSGVLPVDTIGWVADTAGSTLPIAKRSATPI